MKTKLLPNYTRKIAVPLGVLAFLGFIFSQNMAGFLSLNEDKLLWILKDVILVSLLLFVFSEEKKESAHIERLRVRQAVEALGFGAVVLIFDSLSEIFYSNNTSEMKSGYELMIMIFFYYLASYFIKRNIKKPERSTS